MAVQSPKRDVKITQKEALSSQDPILFQIDIFKKHKYPDLSGVLFAPPRGNLRFQLRSALGTWFSIFR